MLLEIVKPVMRRIPKSTIRNDTYDNKSHFVETRGNGRSTMPVPSLTAMIWLHVKMRDNDIHVAVAGYVGRICSHPGFKLAIAADCNPGDVTHFAKRPITVVVEQRVGHMVIGDEDVLPSVVVIIEGDNAESVAGVLR